MTKKLNLVILIVFSSLTHSFSQHFRQIGSRQAGMANASVTINDIWAYHNNPGMLGFLDQGGFGAFYENRFFLREFQYQGLVFAMPTKKGTFSFGGQYSGFELYSTARAGLGYSLALSDNLAMGVQVNYMNVRQAAFYGTKHGVSGEFGIAYKVTDQWTVGAVINNISRSRLADFQNERFETIFRAGVGYALSKRLNINAELEKDIQFPLRVKVGVEYMPSKSIFIRAGAASNQTSFALGLGYKIKNLSIDISSNFVQPLGFHTAVSLHYLFAKKTENSYE